MKGVASNLFVGNYIMWYVRPALACSTPTRSGSSYPLSELKQGLERYLYDYARNITEVTNLKAEKAHLAGALLCNGYPLAFVQAAWKQSTPREHDPETERAGLR